MSPSLRLLASALLLSACATTKVVDTWKAPGFSGPPLKKALVCGLTAQDVSRRTMEDTFVKELATQGVAGVASYTVLPQPRPTADQLRQAVATTGADGVILTRYTGAEEVVSHELGPGYGWDPLYSSAQPMWGSAIAPASPTLETEVRLATRVYSAADGGLVWAATSETFDPASGNWLVKSVVPKLVQTMVKAGILGPGAAASGSVSP